ncbi:MAG TPA: YciI family protein [Longimicrobium sp.]|jgi:hypothetical protein
MRYMIMFKADRDTEDAAPACMVLPEMQRFIGELRRDGVLVATEGLKPSHTGAARVRFSGGRVSVVDGPFTEAKELVAGFVLVEVPSKEDAVALAGRFLRIAGDGTASEVREVFDAPPH